MVGFIKDYFNFHIELNEPKIIFTLFSDYSSQWWTNKSKLITWTKIELLFYCSDFVFIKSWPHSNRYVPYNPRVDNHYIVPHLQDFCTITNISFLPVFKMIPKGHTTIRKWFLLQIPNSICNFFFRNIFFQNDSNEKITTYEEHDFLLTKALVEL